MFCFEIYGLPFAVSYLWGNQLNLLVLFIRNGDVLSLTARNEKQMTILATLSSPFIKCTNKRYWTLQNPNFDFKTSLCNSTHVFCSFRDCIFAVLFQLMWLKADLMCCHMNESEVSYVLVFIRVAAFVISIGKWPLAATLTNPWFSGHCLCFQLWRVTRSQLTI